MEYEFKAEHLLQWALIELCLNPIIQSKLRDELMASCTSADPSWDDLSRSNLPYLDAVVHEALRFHPAISETTRIVRFVSPHFVF